MGFENRDYARTDDRSYSSPGSRMSIIHWIIAVNVAVFVVQCIWTRPLRMSDLRPMLPQGMQLPEHAEDADVGSSYLRIPVIQEWFALDRRAIQYGQVWRFCTYDLLHSTQEDVPWHLVFNMYFLYLLGRKVVDVYSEREFLLLYLTSAVASGAFYLLWGLISGEDRGAIGASGAVSAVMVIYAMRWPHERWALFFVIPVTAIWMCVIYAGLDLYPMLKQVGGHRDMTGTAHSAHIGGMLFGFFYMRRQWHMESLLDRLLSWNPLKRRPKLRVVQDDLDSPDRKPSRRDVARLKERLDELLAKIHVHGQASLTAEEQEELNEASRFFRERR